MGSASSAKEQAFVATMVQTSDENVKRIRRFNFSGFLALLSERRRSARVCWFISRKHAKSHGVWVRVGEAEASRSEFERRHRTLVREREREREYLLRRSKNKEVNIILHVNK